MILEECLTTASKAREGKLVDRDALVQYTLDLCRPEIEHAARNAFLADNSTPLDKAREKAVEAAIARAKAPTGSP
jgi:hypothetical protein